MTSIDLTRIRGDGSVGQRGAFEEFVCQVARRDRSGEDLEFRRVEGSGGDGGVESYWLLKDGTKRAYQAKYWARAGDIDWSQIDKSVKQAMGSHPETVCYTVALSCDLTGRSGLKGKGKTGWEHWDTHRKKWLGWAKAQGLTIEFRVWTAFDLRTRAVTDLAPGAISYWFGGQVFDEAWFEAKARAALNDLGDRYSPFAHIETEVEVCLRAFVRDPNFCRTVVKPIQAFRSLRVAVNRFLDSLGLAAAAAKVAASSEELDRLGDDIFPPDVTGTFCWNEVKAAWVGALDGFQQSHSELRQVAKSGDPTGRAVREIDKLTEAGNRLKFVFCETANQYCDARSLVLLGRFGTGKSHAMGKILETAIADSRPAVLFLGQKFTDANPQGQMLQFADLGSDSTWSEFLDGMNAASEAKGKLGLILIDAVNEGAGIAIWRNHLAGILAEVAQRPALRLIVSCRTEYRDRVLPTAVNLDEYELTGFSEGEFQRACVRLMDDEGISRPNAAFLPPEFYNPLMLSTACRSLQRQGASQFPGSLAGLSDFVDLYVRGVSHAITQQHNLPGVLEAQLRRAFLALADAMVAGSSGVVAEPDARQIVQVAVGRPPPAGTDWLDMILGNGALRLDPDPHPGWKSQGDVVRFAFQIHEQEFIARRLLMRAEDSARPFDVGEPLGFLGAAIEADGSSSSSASVKDLDGVLMALGVLWPDAKDGEELIDVLPPAAECPELHLVVRRSLFEGFLWRRPDRVSARTTALLREVTEPGTFYATMLKFAGIVEHPWNSFSLHEELARYADMASRDAVWTVATNEADDLARTIQGHIRWTLDQTSPFPEAVIGELAAVALTWTLTSTNRTLRDRATKALVHLFRTQPTVMPAVLRRFTAIDDVYVTERLMAAVYGACCVLPSEHVHVAAGAVYTTVFAGAGPPKHLLVRDYALGVIERAEFLSALPEEVEVEVCRQPHPTAWPLEMHTNAEVDALAASVGDGAKVIARSCTTEYGRGVSRYGDFGRYVLESRVRRFLPVTLDVERPNRIPHQLQWKGELIGNWVAHRAYELGWHADRFPGDRTRGEYVGRLRGTCERIGKKYQWIAMYELLGILSDHVWCKDRYDDPKPFHSALDLEFCRDIDPTVMSQKAIERVAVAPAAELNFGGLGDVRLAEWPFQAESLLDFEQATTFVDDNGRRWYRLYARASEDSLGDQGAASYMSFASVSTVCVARSDLDSTLGRWEQGRLDAAFDLRPPELIDHEYLHELGWRETRDAMSGGASRHLSADRCATQEDGLASVVCRYVWEHGRDESLADGVSCLVPAPWVANGTGLTMDAQCPAVFTGGDGSPRFFGFDESSGRGNATCLLDAEAFDRLLLGRDLVCLWVLGGERLLALGIGRGRRRFFSGIGWFEDGEFRSRTWWDDNGS